ncbi:MAG: response regulator [Gemmatimonadetes bacterium]|nr:response regulator [Gemmatimonadota bacterium]
MPKGRILVVEDNALVRECYAQVLGALGYEVAGAPNGAVGVEMAAELLPDLVLMDLRMPVMDGWTAKDRLRADPRTAGIPVVAVTSAYFARPEDSPENRGFDGYVRKPVGVYEMLQIVGRFLPATTPAPQAAVE